ncbi:MAG: PLP-dependent aminotransferase family protein [Acidimicrobiales bacterium]|nr:PLP-dependent aminotransferase family protein [Acidimicrobiales bacterium]
MDVLLDIDLTGGRRQGIERALRAAIRDGRLVAGTPLPSTRALAADLGVARGTVVDAYDQLVAEGFLSARAGGRTVVAAAARRPAAPPSAPVSAAPQVDLTAGAPDLSSFPAHEWVSALRSVLRDGPADALDYVGPRGRPELHAALVDYLARARGVMAEPEQVVVFGGVDHAFAVVTRALAVTGRRTVAMEDPGLPFHRRIVADAGGEVVAVPVDEGGIDAAAVAVSDADAVIVTPARQAVLGATLAPGRRGDLVAWALASGAVVVEDDYDGELRYDRQPIGALQALDPERVLYVGTASKSLAPGLRLAWAVVPPALVGAVESVLPPHSPVSSLDQLVLADLIRGHVFDRHLRRARSAYRRRRDRFAAVLRDRAPAVQVEGVAAGLHALVRWPAGTAGEDEVLAEATARGIAVTAVGPMWHGPHHGADGLLVGYGRPPAHDVRRCFDAFADLMADMTPPRRP